MGINIDKNYGKIKCFCDKIYGEKIDFEFPSVGATENAILASCLGEGTTIITNVAREPEIIDLQNFLNRMGAKVKGAGSNKIEVEGVKKLKDVSYNIMPDRIETGTFLCLSAITGGNLLLENTEQTHIVPIIDKLEEAGCNICASKNTIEIKAPKRLKGINIKTMPYPGFPTDMQAILGATLTTAKGTSVIIENIFENRFKYTRRINKNGSKNISRRKNGGNKRSKKVRRSKSKSNRLKRWGSISTCRSRCKRKDNY